MNKRLLLLLLLLCFGCRSNPIKEDTACNPPELSTKSYDFVIHLPLEGCSPCIGKTIDFIKDNADAANLGVILHASLQKQKEVLKREYFQNIDFVKVGTASTLQVDGFPQLLIKTRDQCEKLVLDASNLELELGKLKLKLERNKDGID
ncbi:hypothetical protein [Roseivirga sp.]|uniref:hypothetical protein n=1 Tax=Roseivirga sp. TaxID=1964215 RepID=UPI003B521918